MTREEAIEIIDKMPLCNECDSSNFPYTCVECGDAFLMAIEALKQPEIVRCKDCVHLGKADKCIVAKYLHEHPEKIWLLSMQSEWFCADGIEKDTDVLNK